MNNKIKEILSFKEDADYKRLSIEEILLLKEYITNLEESSNEYERIGIMQFNRPYAKRYLKECKKENPKLLYPDTEDIYKKYYNLKEENKKLTKALEKDNRVSLAKYNKLKCEKEALELTFSVIKENRARIDKAIEYVKSKKAIINTDYIRIFDLFKIDEQGYTDELLEILQGSDSK